MIPAQLASELESLRATGYLVEAVENSGVVCLVFKEYQLPHGYNKTASDLLVQCPESYPNGNPDMFWMDSDLQLKSGQGQANTNQENVLSKNWLRFSWHIQKWNPGRDNMFTYLEFVNRRLAQLK